MLFKVYFLVNMRNEVIIFNVSVMTFVMNFV